jgi:molybdopterin molybdotransferase
VLEFEEALEIILKHARRAIPLRISPKDSLGYVLAEEIKARESIPLFDSSSVDGYAVQVRDIKTASDLNPVQLPVALTVSAGSSVPRSLKPLQTIKIMTGAPLPRKTDAVVMKEAVRVRGETIIFTSPGKEGANIRRRGEEFSQGEVVLSKGTVVTPPVIGLLATLGYGEVKVYGKPSVALVITGNEVRSPSDVLRRGQIRDSNSYSISAVLRTIGISPVLVVRVRDKKEDLSKAFARAIKKADVVVSAGGVSVGDFDFVKDVLSDLRVKTVFWRVAMKPGKPNYFGTRGSKLIFGLPGNPVSALVSLETLVVPALQKMTGLPRTSDLVQPAVIETEFRRSPGRVEFVRAVAARMPDGTYTVKPVIGQGSHMLGGLAKANCLMMLSEEKDRIEKGETVVIRFLSWMKR